MVKTPKNFLLEKKNIFEIFHLFYPLVPKFKSLMVFVCPLQAFTIATRRKFFIYFLFLQDCLLSTYLFLNLWHFWFYFVTIYYVFFVSILFYTSYLTLHIIKYHSIIKSSCICNLHFQENKCSITFFWIRFKDH